MTLQWFDLPYQVSNDNYVLPIESDEYNNTEELPTEDEPQEDE